MCLHKCLGQMNDANNMKLQKKLLPVRIGLVAKSITSPEMFRYSMACSRTCALLAVHAHC